MSKISTSIRVADLTRAQIAELAAKTGLTQTEVIAVAIDRMHRAEAERDKPRAAAEE